MSCDFIRDASGLGVSLEGTTTHGDCSAAICSVLGFHFRSTLVVATDYGTKREPDYGLSFELRGWVWGPKL